jgi:hypothetical protein
MKRQQPCAGKIKNIFQFSSGVFIFYIQIEFYEIHYMHTHKNTHTLSIVKNIIKYELVVK